MPNWIIAWRFKLATSLPMGFFGPGPSPRDILVIERIRVNSMPLVWIYHFVNRLRTALSSIAGPSSVSTGPS